MTADEAQLRQLNERYIPAYLNADTGWYDHHLADDFLCIDSDGSVLDKPAFLLKTERGPGVAHYRLEDVRVRIYHDVALVHGTGLFERADGTSGVSRYTDVYVQINQEWKAVSAQITRTYAPAPVAA